MRLRMWTYDLAREQAPTLDHLRRIFEVTRKAGYNAIGLYLEHRFAYPSTPWAHGRGVLTPEMVQTLMAEFPDIQVIPFLNLLGHMEGLIYTEAGSKYAVERFKGMQADPTNPQLVRLAEAIIDDALAIFPSDIIHIGGDETFQLGKGASSERVVREYERDPGVDGKARLYADHFAPLAQRVQDAGRRPAVWGDMYFEHPTALEAMPSKTIIFDWQYFSGPRSERFIEAGYEVVFSPTIHTYNAAWIHLSQAEANVRAHAVAAESSGALGVCVTTWEAALFGNYDTMLPAILGAGRILQNPEEIPASEIQWDASATVPEGMEPVLCHALEHQATRVDIRPEGDGFAAFGLVSGRSERLATLTPDQVTSLSTDQPISGVWRGQPFAFAMARDGETVSLTTAPWHNGQYYYSEREAPTMLRAYLEEGELHEEFARLMGIVLQDAGGLFGFSGIRSSLKCRLLLYSNPFLLWLRNREDLVGEVGDRALLTLDHAISVAPDVAYRGVAEFVRLGIEFVRFAEESHLLYAAGLPGQAAAALIPCRQVFENLIRIAKATNLRIGGSLADIERCIVAREHVERVIRRVKEYGDGNLGYLPSFETLTHPKFMPHDQGNWWLINDWANE